MSVASRINALFIFSGLILISLATGYVAERDYAVSLDKIVDNALARTQKRPDLPFYFYRNDEASLAQYLEALLNSKAVVEASAHGSTGKRMAQRQQDK